MERFLYLFVFFFPFFSVAQFIEAPIGQDLPIGKYPQLTGDRGVAAFQYNDSVSGLKVNVVVWDNSSAGFYWSRTVGGIKVSDTVHFASGTIPRNLDVVVGDSGNKVLIAYQWDFKIWTTVFTWNGSAYNWTSTNMEAFDANYLYGGPHLAINSSDSVVLTWRSYGASQTQQFLAKVGSVNGVFANYPHPLNAFSLTDSLLFNISATQSIDVDVFTSDSGVTQVFFSFAYKTSDSTFLEMVQIPLLDLQFGKVANMRRVVLQGQPLSDYIIVEATIAANWDSKHPSYRGAADPLRNEIMDEWVAAAVERDFLNDKRNIVLYKGLGGGNVNRVVITDGDLTNCPNQTPSLAYGSGYLYVAWSHKHCGGSPNLTGANLSGWDGMGRIVDNFTGAPKHIRRLNDDVNLLSDQIRIKVHVGSGDSTKLLLAYYNDSTGVVNVKEISESYIGLSEIHSVEPISVYPVPIKADVFIELSSAQVKNTLIEVFDLTGRLVCAFEAENNLDGSKVKLQLAELEPGIYLMGISNETFQHTVKVIKH